jgi:polyphosphate kinase
MSAIEASDFAWLANKPGPALNGRAQATSAQTEPPSEHNTTTTQMASSADRQGAAWCGPRFLERDLSWLDFNARVLELAADARTPLLERVKFCAIFASNLDEFFMIRVAGLAKQAAADAPLGSAAQASARQTSAAVRRRVLELEAQKETIWRSQLQSALAEYGIVIAAVEDLDDHELGELKRQAAAEIYPLLTPLAAGNGQPFPRIPGTSLSVAALLRDPCTGEVRVACVDVPQGLPRFTSVGSHGVRVPIEQSVIQLLPRLFPLMDVVEHAVFRVTRDADFQLADETEDLIEAVSVELRRRRFGNVVRLELVAPVPPALLAHLSDGLAVEDEHTYTTDGLLRLSDLNELAALDRPELKHEPWASRTPARLAAGMGARDIFAEIDRGDVLVHHPYDSFSATFERFVSEGARDPRLGAIKTTVYRTSDESPVVPALVEVAESGGQAVCLVELKARFDEKRNIDWAHALESAGVHVAYGFSDLKIHAKTTLIVRRDRDGVRRYVHVGTGNYHALTARSYEDFGLFTADQAIAEDISDFFNLITGFGRPTSFRKILVAPFNLRERLVEEIRAVARSAAAGETARIRLKTNALTDDAIINELYAASQAGAAVDIVARSICTLRPGVSGLSENVRVLSVLGRFLEHSRVFLFDAGERSSAYLGSADLMPRNLDDRIEVVVPVEDAGARAELEAVFDVLLADDTAWVLACDGAWRRRRVSGEEPMRQSHETLMRRDARAEHAARRPLVRVVGASSRGAPRLRGRAPRREKT